MTARVTTSTRPSIDEHTEAELQPPCEVVEIHVCAAHGTVEPHRCTAVAAWAARVTCTCSAPELVLICTPHLHAAQHLAVGLCKKCRHPARVISAERI